MMNDYPRPPYGNPPPTYPTTPTYPPPPGGQLPPYVQQPYHGQLPYGQPLVYGQPQGSYGQPPQGYGIPYGQYPGYGYQPPYKKSPEVIARRRQFFKSCLQVGGAILTFDLIQLFLGLVVQLFFPGLIQNSLGEASVTMLFLILSLIIPFGLLARTVRKSNGVVWPGRAIPFGTFLATVSIGLSVTFFGNYLTGWISNLFSIFGINLGSPDFTPPSDPLAILVYVISMTLLPAFLEEFATRGVVLGALRPYGDGVAIWCSAITFALMHNNMVQGPFTLVMGLILGYLVVYTDSIWPAVAVHFLNNLIAVFFQFAPQYLEDWGTGLLSLGYLVLMISGVIVLVVYYSKHRGFLRVKSPARLDKTAAKVSVYLSTPTVILSVLIFLLMAVWMSIGIP